MAASRLQHWAILLSAYEYDIEYVRSADNGTDGLSRLPVINNGEMEREQVEQTYLHFAEGVLLLDHVVLRKETEQDNILDRVIGYINYGWPDSIEID